MGVSLSRSRRGNPWRSYSRLTRTCGSVSFCSRLPRLRRFWSAGAMRLPIRPCHGAIPFPHAAHSFQPRAPCRIRLSRLPLLPFRGRNLAVGGNSADRGLHDVPFANIHASVRAGAGARQPRDRRADSVGKVHALPDYVYFDHSIHIAKGVGCTTCHWQVDQMPLTKQAEPMTMGWVHQLSPRSSALFAQARGRVRRFLVASARPERGGSQAHGAL